MILTIKTNVKTAQKVVERIRELDILDKRFATKREGEFLFIPVLKKTKIAKTTLEEKPESFFPKTRVTQSFKEALKNHLSDEEFEKLKTSYDIVGNIAILEIDRELRSKEKEIAQALLTTNKQIKTVLRKDGSHEGVFRSQKMKFIAGIDTKEAHYVENGVKMDVNVETVYFSPRLSTERMRLAKQIKKNEDVLVFFSGAAPYPLVFAKHSKAKHIVGIEINPQGHKYGLHNIALNKIKNITLYCGDANEVSKKINEKFDHIYMPLPKSADEFLDSAFHLFKDKGIIHFYDFLHEEQFSLAEEKIKQAAKRNGFESQTIGIYTCGCQGIRTYRICVDAKVWRVSSK